MTPEERAVIEAVRDDLLTAAEAVLADIQAWIDSNECDCPCEGHVCGRAGVQGRANILRAAVEAEKARLPMADSMACDNLLTAAEAVLKSGYCPMIREPGDTPKRRSSNYHVPFRDIVTLRAAVEAERAKPQTTGTCEWTWDETTDSWDTKCGEKFQFITGGIKENKTRFCQYCAKRIVERTETFHD